MLPMGDLAKADFGSDFTWGVAHASYQVEGAWNVDGKGPSIWDTFTHGGGRVRNKDTGDVACDFYHRYDDDTDARHDLGFDAQRFSISWPRVLPNGTGPPTSGASTSTTAWSTRASSAASHPWVTLYHWDLPQALQDRGGWANRSIVGWFEDYVGIVADRLGDRVKDWMVFNEPCSFLVVGHLLGYHAPGTRSLRKYLAGTHHVNLAQAAAARVLRSKVPTPTSAPPTSSAPWSPRATPTATAGLAPASTSSPTASSGSPTSGSATRSTTHRSSRASTATARPATTTAIVVDWDFIGVQYYTRTRLLKPCRSRSCAACRCPVATSATTRSPPWAGRCSPTGSTSRSSAGTPTARCRS
jgi:beta-glucosidase